MSDSRQNSFRGLLLVKRNEAGDSGFPNNPRADGSLVTRAYQPVPNFAAITPILGLDGEFQQVFIISLGKSFQRIGRFSIVNMYGVVIYDVFAFYPEKEGYQKRLPPKWKKLGVYWPDIKPKNGACPIAEVEYNIKQILSRAKIAVGHSIANDIKVCSEGVFDGIEVRDTQLYESYREYGKLPLRLPKLSVLAEKVCQVEIQVEDHSSVEDEQITTMLAMRVWPDLDQQQKGWTAETVLHGAGNATYDNDAHTCDLQAAVDVDEITKICIAPKKVIVALPAVNDDSFPCLAANKSNALFPVPSTAYTFWQNRTSESGNPSLDPGSKTSQAIAPPATIEKTGKSVNGGGRESRSYSHAKFNRAGSLADFERTKSISVTSLSSFTSKSSSSTTGSVTTRGSSLSSSDLGIPTTYPSLEVHDDISETMPPETPIEQTDSKVPQAGQIWAAFRKRDDKITEDVSKAKAKPTSKLILKAAGKKST